MVDEKGNKKYSRHEINRLASSFYQNIYDIRESSEPVTPLQIDKEDPEPEIIAAEVEGILRNLKNNKSGGEDKIVNEQLKYGQGTGLVKWLVLLFNKILQTQKIPTDWKTSNIILLHKKGDKHVVDNYRPISLSSSLSKIFSKILEKRIKGGLMSQQPVEQAGFRAGFSTTDHLFTLNQVIEKAEEYQIDLHLAFVDFRKAFDSINHEFMLQALKNQGVPHIYIKIIEEMYTDLKARIITDVKGELFGIKKGVKQGDPLSPIIFCAALEEIFKKLNWENKGTRINGTYLSNLRFADDVVIIAKNSKELGEMIGELKEESQKGGLLMNVSKTKIMSKNPDSGSKGNCKPEFETVKETKYLGQIISLENKWEKEINNRIALGWKKFWSLKHIFKGNYSIKNKTEILNSCVLPVIAYGSQTWTVTKKLENKLRVTQNSMVRSLLKITLRDKVRITSLNQRMAGRVDFVREIKRKKWEWAGHIVRVKDERWGKKIIDWFPREENRKPGKQRTRWRDEITGFIHNSLFTRVAQDRAEWARLKESFARGMGFT